MLTYVIAFGALMGAVDYICNNRLGIGKQFEEGFLCLGSVALSIAGMICIAPVIGEVLKPIVVVLYRFLGIDPAMFGSLLANNMGGYPLAMELADDPRVGLFSGLIVASMLGAALVYTIPVALGIVGEDDKTAFMKGVLIGLIPIPIGSAIGGLIMGLATWTIIWNSIPAIVVTVFLVVGFRFFYRSLILGFAIFARGIRILSIAGLGLAAFTSISGITLIPAMDKLENAMLIVSGMGIVQLGSLPMAALFVRLLNKPLQKIGAKCGMNASAVATIPIACVNAISVFSMVKSMNQKGIVISAAWCTNVIAVFTAHLAYTRVIAPEMVNAVLAAKIISGFLALLLALFIERKSEAIDESIRGG